MNLLKLSWRNICSKPFNAGLTLILFALGVGLISLLFLLQDQLQKNFERNLAKVDLVIGAKGSPLQMILSSMYHIDAPTGNISLDGIRPFLNPRHPLIESALPMSLGDSYRAYRIVGTETDILDWYEASLEQGELYTHNFDVVLGAGVARDLGLSLGDRFKSSHGLVDDDGLEHDDVEDFVVTGILSPSGTIIDQLILTTPQTYWHVHDHPSDIETEDVTEEAHTDHDHADHDHADHDHADHDDHHHEHGHSGEIPIPLIEEAGDRSITNLLIRFKGKNFQALNMQRSINENTDMQAATPAIEITRLFTMMDTAEKALRILAMVIIFVSGLSIFISLYSSLRDRRYELSLMRVMGGTPRTLFLLIILEGLLLSVIGFVLGLLLSHVGMTIIGRVMNADYRYDFSGATFLGVELWIFLATLALGLIAALIPAYHASKTDISDTLSRG